MRIRRIVMVVAVLMLVGGSASALPGPDPATSRTSFSVVVAGRGPDGVVETFDTFAFSGDHHDGYDFGDRESYRCAFVEFLVADQVTFKVEYERLDVPGHPADYVAINDRGGVETGEGGNPPSPGDICGMPDGAGPRTWQGEPFEPGGVEIPVLRGGELLQTVRFPETASNPETHYSVGDEPGEVYLWYAEEGENPGELGEAVLRIVVIPVAPDVTLLGPTCYSGTLVAEDGSGRTRDARICDPGAS